MNFELMFDSNLNKASVYDSPDKQVGSCPLRVVALKVGYKGGN